MEVMNTFKGTSLFEFVLKVEESSNIIGEYLINPSKKNNFYC